MAVEESFQPTDEVVEQDLGQEPEAPEASEIEGADEAASQEPTIDIGGKQYKLAEVAEWQKGYMRQSDYTQKTQQVAQQRQQVEELRQAAEAWQTVS